MHYGLSRSNSRPLLPLCVGSWDVMRSIDGGLSSPEDSELRQSRLYQSIHEVQHVGKVQLQWPWVQNKDGRRLRSDRKTGVGKGIKEQIVRLIGIGYCGTLQADRKPHMARCMITELGLRKEGVCLMDSTDSCLTVSYLFGCSGSWRQTLASLVSCFWLPLG